MMNENETKDVFMPNAALIWTCRTYTSAPGVSVKDVQNKHMFSAFAFHRTCRNLHLPPTRRMKNWQMQ